MISDSKTGIACYKVTRGWADGVLSFDTRSGDVYYSDTERANLLHEVQNHPISHARLSVYRTLQCVDNPEDLSDEDLMEVMHAYREQFAQSGLLN